MKPNHCHNLLSKRRRPLVDLMKEEALTALFQPIIDIQNGYIVGHKALIRGPEKSEYRRLDQLLRLAQGLELTHELEQVVQDLCIKLFPKASRGGKIFLNIGPTTILDIAQPLETMATYLNKNKLSLDNIVVELSAKHPLNQCSQTVNFIKHYRDGGVQIAISDLAVGDAGLKSWYALQPNYVKIDKYLIRGVDLDPVKRNFVMSIMNMARKTQSQIIAEGIETVEELRTLQLMGIDYGQGYLLGDPTEKPVTAGQQLPIARPPKFQPNLIWP
ncbi:EAL domain-containing protein [Marinobacterium arenosum]|uniref:EAL domain-containing protein n=1 Tax=Marinobacterium arenosum TaxID=2862496 RepID=UPI001C976144|nr:EAL domain-containing protein [Marinobacterium arenosum]MBY4677129.1 EAL domain-containing protein [Marinobacterium arenosum]